MNIKFDLTPEQEKALQHFTDAYNKEHWTKLSIDEYVQLRAEEILAEMTGTYQEKVMDETVAQFKEKFIAADEKVKAQVLSTLGIEATALPAEVAVAAEAISIDTIKKTKK